MAQKFRIHIQAPRSEVYQALISPEAIAKWKVPDGMTSQIHEFNAKPGGSFRVSLTYKDTTNAGKSGEHTDTYHGTFKELIPNEKVVDESEFETDDPNLKGKMTITFHLKDANGGTDIEAVHEGLPPAVSPEANEEGWMMSLGKLKTLLEKKESMAPSIAQRILRVFAITQAIGGLFGIWSYVYAYGSYIIAGEMYLSSVLLIFFVISVFATLIYASVKYWRTRTDNLLWRALLVMQIPAFQVGNWGYEFSSGLSFYVGYWDERYQASAELASTLSLIWNVPNIFPSMSVNLVPFAALVLLRWVAYVRAN